MNLSQDKRIFFSSETKHQLQNDLEFFVKKHKKSKRVPSKFDFSNINVLSHMATCGTKLKPGRPRRSAAESKSKLKLEDVKQTFAVEKSGRKRALSLSLKKLEEADRIACLGKGKAPAEPVVCLMCQKVFHRVHFVQNHASKCPKLNNPKGKIGILAYLEKKMTEPSPESNEGPSPESAELFSGEESDEEIEEPNPESVVHVNDESSGDSNDGPSPEPNEVVLSDNESDEEIDQPYDESPGEDDDGPSKWQEQFRWHFLLKDLRHLKYCMDNKVSVQWKSFYHEPAHPLLAKNHSMVTHHRRRVCIWHPELFFPKLCPALTCPHCKGTLKKRGWNKQGPRLVTGIGEEYFVLCRQHSCTNCKKTFLGYDQKLLSQLPFVIKDAFPCMIFRKAALDKSLVAMLKRQITSGQSFEDFRLMLEELLQITYLRHKVTYLTLSVSSSAPVIDDFSDFKFRSDLETYPGRVPSSDVLKEAYTQIMSREKEKKRNYVASLKGKILCGDHTFKVAKVPTANHTRIYEALYSVMNEIGQVIGYWMTHGSSLEEVKPELVSLSNRYEDGSGPELFYTDKCCQERASLSECFPSLADLQTKDGGQAQRILLDIFHLMERYGVSKKHVLYSMFMGMLRDAIFIVNEDDFELEKDVLLGARGYDQKQFESMKRSYLVGKSRVRRRVPPAATVAQRVDAVVKLFHKIDPKFITKAVLKQHENNMNHLNKGCISDHPDVPLYVEMKRGNNSIFQKLKVARSTSKLEGFHYYVANSTAGKIISPMIFDLMLLELVFRWNVKRAWEANAGPKLPCFDLDLLDELQELWMKHSKRISNCPLPPGYQSYNKIIQDEPPKFGCERVLSKSIMEKLFSDDVISAYNLLSITAENEPEEQPLNISHELLDEFEPAQALEEEIEESVVEDESCESQSLELTRLIISGPYPKPVRTREEIILFLSLYREYSLDNNRKMNFSHLAFMFNKRILNMLREATERKEDASAILKIYSFKLPSQLRSCADSFAKNLTSRISLHGHWDEIKKLQMRLQQLESTDNQLPLVSFSVPCVDQPDQIDNNSDETDFNPGNSKENLHSRVTKRKAGEDSKQEDNIDKLMELKRMHGEDFVANVLDPKVSICCKCRMVMKTEGVKGYMNGHREKGFCPSGEITEEDKKLMDSIKKKVKRLHQAQLKLAERFQEDLSVEHVNEDLSAKRLKEDLPAKRLKEDGPAPKVRNYLLNAVITKNPSDVKDVWLIETRDHVIKTFMEQKRSLILQCYPLSPEILKPLFKRGKDSWLTSDIINYYGELIMGRSCKNPTLPNVFVLTSYLYTNLISNGYAWIKDYAKESIIRSRFPDKANLFDFDFVMIPINIVNQHWSLVVVDLNTGKIRYLDSLHAKNQTILNTMEDYLRREHVKCVGKPCEKSWTREFPDDIPKQLNGNDCGVFVCSFMEAISAGRPLSFSQDNMPTIRKRMAHEMIVQRLFQ